ncbi:MAG TPA: PLP-dependent aminotransferase family protein [Tepidisphaeraceae bacterium]|jgi:2-aminoadipate transaminase|nr:PLP-dependent aminotransferase family protein [Tepidisphaeraceae bacterium]
MNHRANSPTPAPPLPLSSKARRTREQPISFLIETALHNPGLINLAAGLVDPLTLPVEECAQITQRLFADPHRARTALQYDTTVGLRALRQKLVEHIAALEGVAVADLGYGAEQIVVTTGSQQALYLVGDALIDPGDIVIAANPSYFVYTGTLQSLGANVLAVPMDEEGMDVEAVAALLDRLEREGKLPRVKLIYCTTYFDNPTGLSLSPPRRQRLLDIVRSYASRQRILIQEDAAYRELRYDGPAMRSIKSLEPENVHTLMSLTFSKPFAPGIKLGYTAMPDDLLHAVLQQKGNHDFGSANLAQHIALETLRDGSYQNHVEVLKQSYRAKRDAMLTALDRHMPGELGARWTHPHGGLYVWLTLPEGFDTSREGELFRAAVAAGVLYVPGDYCFQPDDKGHVPKNHIRLSFGQVDPAKIEPGIERLAKVAGELAKASLAATRV